MRRDRLPAARGVFTPLAALVLTALALDACGGGGGGPAPSGPSIPAPSDPPPADTPTVTITAAGAVNPKQLRVAVGSRVRFVNEDRTVHEMTSDPHPLHTDCPPLNEVGVLRPGESRTSGALQTARACGYHDHGQDTNEALRGVILVGDAQAATAQP